MDETEKKLIKKLIKNTELFKNETMTDTFCLVSVEETNTLLNLIKRQEEKIEQLDLINSNYSAIASQQQKKIENYKNLIEDVGYIAKELKLEEDGTIDEILIKIKQQQKEIKELKERQDYARLEKEQLLEDTISKDKIKSLLKQVNASLYHFKDSDKNNIMQRIKDRLEQLLEE